MLHVMNVTILIIFFFKWHRMYSKSTKKCVFPKFLVLVYSIVGSSIDIERYNITFESLLFSTLNYNNYTILFEIAIPYPRLAKEFTSVFVKKLQILTFLFDSSCNFTLEMVIFWHFLVIFLFNWQELVNFSIFFCLFLR